MDSAELQGEQDRAASRLRGLSPCPCILINAQIHLSLLLVFGFILILHMAGNNTVSKSSKFIPSHLHPCEISIHQTLIMSCLVMGPTLGLVTVVRKMNFMTVQT